MTGLYLWLGYRLSERVWVWGVTGYGSGSLLPTPTSGAPLESAVSMAMAAGALNSGAPTEAKCGTKRGQVTAASGNLPVFNNL